MPIEEAPKKKHAVIEVEEEPLSQYVHSLIAAIASFDYTKTLKFFNELPLNKSEITIDFKVRILPSIMQKWMSKDLKWDPKNKAGQENLITTLRVISFFTNNEITASLFQYLLFNQPKYTVELLKQVEKAKIDYSIIVPENKLTELPMFIEHLGLASNEIAFLECIYLIEKLTNKKLIVTDDGVLDAFMQDDLCYPIIGLTDTFGLADTSKNELFCFYIFYYDSHETLDNFLTTITAWKKKSEEEILKEKCMFSKDIDELIKQAISNRAYKCLTFLLEKLEKIEEIDNTDKIDVYLDYAILSGDALTILSITKNNIDEAANHIFALFTIINEKDAELIEKLKITLLTFMRFSPLDIVKNLFTTFLNNADNSSKILLSTIYNDTKLKYDACASYFARYTNQLHINHVTQEYKNSDAQECEFEKIVHDDIAYGESRAGMVKTLTEKLKRVNLALEPKTDKFLTLPPSTKKTRIAAALLEEVIEYDTKHRKVKDKDFEELREGGYVTPMVGRYGFGKTLARSVYHFSTAEDMTRTTLGYDLLYEGRVINKIEVINGVNNEEEVSGAESIEDQDSESSDEIDVEVKKGERTLAWRHGRLPLNENWKSIEDLVCKALTMPLNKKPKSHQYDDDGYDEKQLNDFYNILFELIWLVGNTQPRKRGTGTYVEALLGVITKARDLPTPILTIQFPQLDVLNISFPLSDYKSLLPHFIEPSSLPKQMRKSPPDPSVSLFKYLTQVYKKWNHQKERLKAEERIRQFEQRTKFISIGNSNSTSQPAENTLQNNNNLDRKNTKLVN